MEQWNRESSPYSKLNIPSTVPSLIFKNLLSNCWLGLAKVKDRQGHLLTLLTCQTYLPCLPFIALAAILSVLPHTQSFLPHAISLVCNLPIFPVCPNTQLTICSLPEPESLQGLAAPVWFMPSLISPSDSEWHCPTLHLTTGSSERGFFGSWCGCDLGSPGKTKSSLRAGAGSSSSLVSPRQGSAHSGWSKLLIAWQGDGLDDLWGHTQPRLGYTTMTSASATVWSSLPQQAMPCCASRPLHVLLSEMSFSPFSTWKTTINLSRTQFICHLLCEAFLPDFSNSINSSFVDISIGLVQQIFTGSQLCCARYQGNINQTILPSRSSQSSGETNEYKGKQTAVWHVLWWREAVGEK